MNEEQPSTQAIPPGEEQNENDTTRVFDVMEDVDPQLSDDVLRRRLQIPDWTKIESYSDLHMLGMGGIGTVFSAKEPVLYRNVAIKMLRQENRRKPSALENLMREARMTAQIDHPNIVPVYSIGVFDEVGAYFTMKQVVGRDLSVVIKKAADGKKTAGQEYTLRRLLEVFISVCNAIAFAHSKGIIHRDLKPGNIMLGEYGEVLVMDWGMALYRSENDNGKGGRKIDLHEQEIQLSDPKHRTVSGTPAYMSPEQVRGDLEKITEKSDQYSLGAILYSILTLQPSPFEISDSTEILLKKVLHGDFKPPRKRSLRGRIPRELEAICLKAMSYSPEDRYSSVTALRNDVRNYLDMFPVEVYNPLFLRLIKYCRRKPLLPAMLVGAIFSTLGIFAYNEFDSYTQYSNQLKIAAENIRTVELEHQKLHRIMNLMESQLKSRPGDVERLNLEYFSDRQRFLASVYHSLNSLERAGASGAPLERFAPEAEKLLKTILCYYNTHGETDGLRRILSGMQPPLRTVLNRLFLADSSLALRTQLVLAGKTKVSILAAKGTPITAEYYEKEDKPPRILKLGTAPYNGKLDSGVYVFCFGTGSSCVRVPYELKSGDTCEIEGRKPAMFPPDTVLIGAGSYYSGISGAGVFGRKRYLPDFLIDRRGVTIAHYRQFYNQCSSSERKRFLPRIVKDSELVPLWDENGKLLPRYQENMSVVGIGVEAAQAYCRYLGRRYGMEVRLPLADELEKAGRGPDRRLYVWGNEFDETKALLRDSPAAELYPAGAPAGTFPLDRSLYDVFDLTGNVRELAFQPDGNIYVAFGGSFNSPANLALCGATSPAPAAGDSDIGFRCVYKPLMEANPEDSRK